MKEHDSRKVLKIIFSKKQNFYSRIFCLKLNYKAKHKEQLFNFKLYFEKRLYASLKFM